jgi:hypothetical protein
MVLTYCKFSKLPICRSQFKEQNCLKFLTLKKWTAPPESQCICPKRDSIPI